MVDPQDNSEIEVADSSVEETVDWKAKFSEMEARALKAENDKKAIQGAKSKQYEQDSLLQEILARVESGEKANAALIRALANQDTDNLSTELGTIQSEANNSRAQARFTQQYQSVYDSISEAATDEDGNLLIDFERDPRLQSFRDKVVAGYNKGSIVEITNALPEYHRLLIKIERENAKAAVLAAREEAEESSKKKLRKAGLGDHDLGSSAAGGANGSGMSAKELIMYGLEKSKKNN